ncbi:uncharacterized protein [Physcomitrium patens]|uniref:uncharacterized protein n=1 Tax=Physcomitrium patens TaxID=3218 RepID=UPI003CCD0DBE
MPQTQCSTSAASLSDTLMHPLAYGAQTFFLDLDLESPGVDLQCQADSNHRKIQEFEISGVLYWCLVSTVTRNSCPISRQPCNFVNSRDPARIVHMTEVGAHNLCKQFLPDPGVNGPARFKHLTQHKYDIDALTELSRSLSLQAQGKSRLELYRVWIGEPFHKLLTVSRL